MQRAECKPLDLSPARPAPHCGDGPLDMGQVSVSKHFTLPHSHTMMLYTIVTVSDTDALKQWTPINWTLKPMTLFAHLTLIYPILYAHLTLICLAQLGPLLTIPTEIQWRI